MKSERSDKPRGGVSHSAGRQNSKSIGVDMVFYYGPAQSSRSFVCAFKLFTFSFVNPVAWLRLVSAGKACFFSVMYGTAISVSAQEIWLSVRYVISKCTVAGGGAVANAEQKLLYWRVKWQLFIRRRGKILFLNCSGLKGARKWYAHYMGVQKSLHPKCSYKLWRSSWEQ